MEVPAPLTGWWRRRWLKWLDKRIPATSDITLDQRKVFIFLNRHGLLAALMLLAVFVAGVNYANNLLLGLCFLMGSLMVIAIHHTFANLSGLRITAVKAIPAYAGEPAGFTLRFSNPKGRSYYSLVLDWGQAREQIAVIDRPTEVTVYIQASRRGYFSPPRLRISSVYPLGLFRTWTWLDPGLQAVVYPRPIPGDVMPSGPGGNEESRQQLRRRPGLEDFEGLKEFVPGDPLPHVSWKHLARGQGLLVKTFSEPVTGSNTLDYQAYSGMDRENRLSRLAWWVDRLHQSRQPFALRLPGREIPVGQGPGHREECLTALAVFEAGA